MERRKAGIGYVALFAVVIVGFVLTQRNSDRVEELARTNSGLIRDIQDLRERRAEALAQTAVLVCRRQNQIFRILANDRRDRRGALRIIGEALETISSFEATPELQAQLRAAVIELQQPIARLTPTSCVPRRVEPR